jgi:hypothetical protein
MNRTVRAVAASTGGAVVVTAGALAAPAAAQASARSGCHYPQVCVYVGGQMSHPSGRFVDVTSYWQYLGQSFGGDGVMNTRHDDVVYIKTTSGKVFCIRPGRQAGLYSGGITAIRISWLASCI